MDPELGIMGHN